MKACVRRMVRVRAELGEMGAVRGAQRGDVVVIVDAMRASATITAALQAEANRVIAVRTVEEASAYLDDDRYRVAGERGGAKVFPFHYGNSPTEIWAHRREIAGQTLVLTTSNGTRCINAATEGARAVLVGSTVNASSVARAAFAMARANGVDICLVAAGINDQPADEDTFSQALIGSKLARLGAITADWVPSVQPSESAQVFLASSAARSLIDLGYQKDVRLCARVDIWASVPIYCDGGLVAYGGPLPCQKGTHEGALY